MRKFILSLLCAVMVLLLPIGAQDLLRGIASKTVWSSFRASVYASGENGYGGANGAPAGSKSSRLAREMSPGERMFGKESLAMGNRISRVPQSTGSNDAHYYGFSNSKLYDFNIDPLMLDSLDTDRAYSTYSSVDVKGRIYSFYPVWTDGENYRSSITAVDVYVMDANTFEIVEQYRVDWNKVPALCAFDESTGLIYTLAYDYVDGDRFHLAVVDPVARSLDVVGYVGRYKIGASGNSNFRAFTYADGQLLGIVNDDWVTFDKYTGDITTLKPVEWPRSGDLYNSSMMVRDPNSGSLYWQLFYFLEGSYFYKFDPNLTWGGNGPKNIEFVTKIDGTGYFNNVFYKDLANQSEKASRLTDITDFEVTEPDAAGNVTISFTIPTSTVMGLDISETTASPYCMFYLDGVHKFTSSIYNGRKFGEKVTFEAQIPDGLHSVSITVGANRVPLATHGVVKPTTTVGKMVHVGYGVPAAVGNPSLTIADGEATITWTAPTQSRYADFGAMFDASDLTYKVVRNADGAVIADGIAGTSATDGSLPELLDTYTYTVIPVSHGKEGVAATTNGVVYGSYVALPFFDEFKSEPALYTVYNLDENGTDYQWQWNNFYEFMGCKSSTSYSGSPYPCSDWLITPGFKLSAGVVYELAFKLRGGSAAQNLYSNLKVTIGNGTDWRSQTTVLEDMPHFCYADFVDKKIYFTVPADGIYNIGFYDYTDPQQFTTLLDDLSLREYSSADVPAAATGVAWTATGMEPRGTLTFTVPAVTAGGDAIQAISKVVISAGDAELATLKNQTPGAVKTITVNADNGRRDITVVAYNEAGAGLPATVSAFFGGDVPCAVSNFKAVWRATSQNGILLSWDAPSQVGANGGFVDSEALTYSVYKCNQQTGGFELLRDNIETTSVSITENTAGSQQQYIYGVAAHSATGVGVGEIAYVTLGLPYSLPFNEGFSANGFASYPWFTAIEAGQADWIIAGDGTDPAVRAQDGDGGFLILPHPVGCTEVSTTVTGPIIDLSVDNPMLSFYLYHSTAIPAGSYVEVLVSTDGSDFKSLSGIKATMSDNGGWVRHTYSLASLKGTRRVQFALRGHSSDSESRIYLDRFAVTDAADNDMAAVALIDASCGSAVAGNDFTLTATVANEGAQPVEGCVVSLYAGDTKIAEQTISAAIEPCATVNVDFTAAMTAADDAVNYYAEVTADGDANATNNRTAAHTVTRKSINLNPATDFTGYIDGDHIQLDWDAPEVMTEGLVCVETFETADLWSRDNFGGWTTYDADGQRTISLPLSNNYWPNANATMAYMVWTNPGYFDMWNAYEGDRCLVSWASCGLKADGWFVDGGKSGITNDDWLISPEILGGTEFGFVAMSYYSSHYGPETFDIMVSATDRRPESFTLLKSDAVGGQSDGWTEFSYTLPADARYVAIRHTSTRMAFMLDNLTYTVPVQPVFKGYNVYSDGVIFKSTDMPAFLTPAGINYGKWAVSAVYDLGESPLTRTLDFGVSSLHTATAASGKLAVEGGRGCITVSSPGEAKFDVYGVSGVMIGSYSVAGELSIPLAAGVYIVRSGSDVVKVNVK